MASISGYTRFVALSKHFLWIVAAAIIGVVIWIAEDNNGAGGARIVFSSVPKSENLQNIMMKPHYQGVDIHNRPYTVIADKATQLDETDIAMVTVRADMAMASGDWVALNSGTGLMNTETKQIELHDGVDLFYEGGYEFRSDHAHVDVQQGTASGDAPVEGQGPQGTIKADSFTITDHGQVINFNGSVIVHLYP